MSSWNGQIITLCTHILLLLCPILSFSFSAWPHASWLLISPSEQYLGKSWPIIAKAINEKAANTVPTLSCSEAWHPTTFKLFRLIGHKNHQPEDQRSTSSIKSCSKSGKHCFCWSYGEWVCLFLCLFYQTSFSFVSLLQNFVFWNFKGTLQKIIVGKKKSCCNVFPP